MLSPALSAPTVRRHIRHLGRGVDGFLAGTRSGSLSGRCQLAARGIGRIVVRHLTILFDVLRRRADQRLMGCDAAVGSTLQLVALIKGRVQRGVALSLAATSLLNICTEARWVA